MLWTDEDDEAFKELMMSNQEQDDLVAASLQPDFVGLRGTETEDGGMLIEIGQDPAGNGLVNVMPMFMERIADFATAVELQDMGTFGEPKVPNPSLPVVQERRKQVLRACDQLYGIDKNWPLMLVIRMLEHILAEGMYPEAHNRRNAANSLADAANKLIDGMTGR